MRAYVAAWTKSIVSRLSTEARGFRNADPTDEVLTVRFMSLVDGALAFPFATQGSAYGEVAPSAFRINPFIRTALLDLGLNSQAPVVSGNSFAMLACGDISGRSVTATIIADGFSVRTPVVTLEVKMALSFREEIHEDHMSVLGRGIRAGRPLQEMLEDEEVKKELLAPCEFAALHSLWSGWNHLYQALLESRISLRADFKAHVEEKHGVTEREVMEAISSQIAEPMTENRRLNLPARDLSLRRVKVLGLTEARRLIEVVLEMGGDSSKVVTAFEVDSTERLMWWRRVSASNPSGSSELLSSPKLSGFYGGDGTAGQVTKAQPRRKTR